MNEFVFDKKERNRILRLCFKEAERDMRERGRLAVRKLEELPELEKKARLNIFVKAALCERAEELARRYVQECMGLEPNQPEFAKHVEACTNRLENAAFAGINKELIRMQKAKKKGKAGKPRFKK